MDTVEQKTSVVVQRIYSHLIAVKAKRGITWYSDCFEKGFGMRYNNMFVHFIRQRNGVVNNIPYILGAIGQTCNDLKLPPLCCLVVQKETKQCGVKVITSKDVPENDRPAFAEKVDRPTVYAYNEYPVPGTQQAHDFLNRVMQRLREKGMTRE